MKSVSSQQNTTQKAILYRVVFEMPYVRFVIGVLIGFFLLHPALPVFAADEEVASVEEEVASEESDIEAVEEEFLDEDISQETEETTPIENEGVPEGDDAVSEVDVSPSENINIEGTDDVDEINLEAGSVNAATSTDIEEVQESVAATTSDNMSDAATTTVTATSTDAGDFEEDSNESASEDVETNTGGSIDVSSTTLATSTGSLSDTSSEEETEDEDTSEGSEESTDSQTTGTTTVITTSSTTPDVIITIATSSATSTVAATTTTPVTFVKNNFNTFQFSETECVSVGDGTFYCSEAVDTPEYVEDGVYAAQDTDGDLEIFVTISGVSTQVTQNTVDDAAPYYDSLSKRIVWHSLLNDRYQIVSYDVDSGETEYLTDTTYNNMEPVAYGDITLWQAWVENNWEIVKYENGSTTQLTDNEMHDVAPHMRGGHILWQTQFSEAWQVAVYDIESESIEYIGTGDGSRMENPRMVLVYDSTDSNGDVKTLGYDFDTGTSFSLGSLPAQLPEKLPEPDQTGETRALVQTKPSPKETEVVEIDPIDPDAISNASSTASSATSSETSVIDDTTLVVTDEVIATTTAPAPLESEDIVIEPLVFEDTVSSSTSHIEDIVIPLITSSTTEEVG